MAFLRGALLLLVASPILANPIPGTEETRCATRCPISSKFGYEVGHSYAYQYQADIITKMAGASTEQSAMRMTSDVWIEVLSQCEYMLKMTYVTLVDRCSGSDAQIEGAAEFAQDLERNPLRFAFVDGQIPDLCPEVGESEWVLNIKRSALSAFQNNMDDLHDNTRTREEDVSGLCSITYEVQDSSSPIVVKKTKDVHGCEGHHHLHSVLQDTPFTSRSDRQSPPVFEINSTCTQTFDSDSILDSVTCEEVHKLKPFSTTVSGATSEITVTMTKNQARTGVTGSEGAIHRRESIMFQHSAPQEHSSTNMDAARAVLQDICAATANDVRPEVPGLFMDLVKALKRLDAPSLAQMHGDANGCTAAHKFFHDAVPNIKTLASLTLIHDLLASGDVTGRVADTWVSSLAFSEQIPTAEMVEVAKNILALDSTTYRATMSVATLFNAYCTEHEDCEDLPAIQEALNLFGENLRYNCRANSEEHRDLILLTLKSIGNMGFASDLNDVLGRCIANDDAPMALRVQAVDAYRRMPCSFPATEMLAILDNPNLDPELRIKVYLMLMKCPTPAIIEEVRHILATEEINQVGSFIWTHLTNLMETESHYKQDVRAILEDQILIRAFDLDRRKFSRNIELSKYYESLNLGGQIDGNIIFSHESFLPRSLDLNLTADIYGHSINFVEIGGRIEGVEKVAEAMFKGKDCDEVMDTDFNSEAMIEAMSETRAQIFMRLFGNELSYKDFVFSDIPNMPETFNYLDFLINLASEHDVSFTKSLVLITEELVHPTIAGMPLRMGIHGAATAHVQLTGHMDLRSAFNSPHNIDISGNIKPSAAMEIVGEMGVDAFVASTALKLVTSLHTSTNADINMQLLNGNDFTFDINMPQDNVEILNVNSNVFLRKCSEDVALVMFPDDIYEVSKCSGETLATITGLELCGDFSYPKVYHQDTAPWFPLTGEAAAALVLHKRDTHTGYHFETKLINEANTNTFKIELDTPDSETSRLMSVEFNLNREGRTASLLLISPWKKADLTGSYTDSDTTKDVTLRATIDDERNYGISAQMEYVQNRLNVEYRPRLEISVHGEDEKVISGTIVYREGRRATLTFSMENFFEDTVEFRGDGKKIENNRFHLYEGLISVSSPEFSGKIEASAEKTLEGDPVYTTSTVVEYQFQYEPLQHYKLSTRGVDASTTTRADYTFELSTNSTAYPDHNTTTTLVFTREGMSASLSLLGGLADDTDRRIDSAISWTDTSTGTATSYDGHLKLLLPIQSLDYEVTSHLSSSENERNLNVHANYGGEQAALVIATRAGEDPWWSEGDLSLTYPGKEVTYHSRAERDPSGEYNYNLQIQMDSEDQFVVAAVYRNNDRHEMEADVTSPHMQALHLTGHLKPALSDFSAALNTDYGGSVYEGSLGWAYTPRVHVSANAAIAWPENRYALGASANKAATQNEANLVQLRAEWGTGQFMQLAGRYLDTHQGWWTETRDLQASVILTSTVSSAENVGLSFRHAQQPTEILSAGEVWWADDQKIAVNSTNRQITGTTGWEANWVALTPFSIRQITYTRSYQFENNQLTSTSTLGWDGQLVTLVVNGNLDIESKSMDSNIDLTTPFEGYEHITSTFNFQFDGNSMTSSLHATWEPEQELTITLTGTSSYDDNGYGSSSLNIVMAMPFEQFPQGTITYTYNRPSDNAASTEVTIMRGEDTIWDYESEFSMGSENGGFSLETGIELQLLDLVDFKIGLSHSHDQDYMTIENEFELQWETGQVIHLEYEFSRDADWNANSEMTLTTPFSAFPMLEIVTEITKSGDTYTAHKEIKVDPNSRIVLDSTITSDFTQPIFIMDYRLTTPYEGYERYRLEANNTHNNNVWRSGLAVEYGTDQRIELKGSLGLDETKQFGVGLKTPFEQVEDIGVLYSFTGSTWREFTSHADVRVKPYWPHTATYSNTFSTSDLENIRIEQETSQDSEVYDHMLFTHMLEDNGHYKTELVYTLPSMEIDCTVSNDLSLDLPRVFHSIASLEYEEGHPFELDINLVNDNRKDFSVVLNVPNISPIPDVQFEWSHEGNYENFTTFAIVTSGNNEMFLSRVRYINTQTLFHFKTEGHANGMLADSTDVTPVLLNITVHRSARFDFTSDITLVNYDGRRVTKHTVFIYTRPAATLTSTINIPVEGYETINLNWNLNKNSDYTDVVTNGSVTYGNAETIRYNFAFVRSRRNYSYNFSLATPFEEVSTLSIYANHSGRWYDMTQHWDTEYNGDHYTGTSNFRMTKRVVRGGATIHIPDTYTLSFYHKGFTPTDWANTFEFVDAANVRYAANSHFKMEDTTYEASGVVNTPDEYGFNFNHEGPWDSFENSAEVIIQGKDYHATSSLTVESEHYHTEATFSIPDESKAYSLVLDKQGPLDHLRLKGTADWNGEQYSTGANYTQTDTSYSTAAEVTIPDRHYKVAFDLTGLPEDAHLVIDVNNDGSHYHLTGTYIIEDDGRSSTAQLTTPHEGYGSFGYEISYSSSNGHAVSVVVTTPFENYTSQSARVTHRPTTTGFATVGNLETHHPVVRNIGVDVSHESDDTGFRTSGSFSHPVHNARFSINHHGSIQSFESGAMGEYNGSKIEGSISSNLESGWQTATYHLEASLTTPFEDLRSAQLELSNTMSPETGSGDLDVFKNGEHVVDLDFSANMGDTSGMTINFREPVSGTFTLNVVTAADQETANAVLEIEGERYTADMTMRTPNADSREVDIVLRSPSQEMTFGATYSLTDSAFSHELTIVWDEENDGRFHYNIVATKTQRQARTIYEGTVTVTAGPDTYEGTIYHKYNPDRLVLTRISLDKLTLENELTFRQPGIEDFQNVFTVQHQDMNTDIVITIDGAIDLDTPSIIGTTRVTLDGSVVTFYGKIANESPDASSTLYVAECSVGLEDDSFSDGRFHFIGSVYNNDFNGGINTIMTLSQQEREDEVYNAKIELIKETPALVFETQNHHKDISLTLTHFKDENNHHLQLTGHVDNVPVRGELDIVKRKGMDVKMYYGEDTMGRFYAQLVTPSTASLEIYHEDSGQKIEDVVLSVRLNTTRLMHFRAHMRPTILDGISEAYDSEAMTSDMSEAWNHPSEVLTQQTENINQALQPAADLALEVYGQAEAKATEILDNLNDLYEDNAFHSQDIGNYVVQQTAEVQTAMQEMAQAGQVYLENLQSQVMDVSAVSAVNPVTYSEDLSEWWEGASETLSDAMEEIQGHITEGLENLRESERTQRLQEIWQEIRNMQINTEWIDELSAQMDPHLADLRESYNEALVDLEDFYEEVLGRPEMAGLKDMADSMIESAQQAYEYYGIEERMQQLRAAHSQGLSANIERMRRHIMDYLQLNRTRVTVYDPDNWEFQAEAYLPMELQDLTSIPRWPIRVRRAILQMRNSWSGYMPDRQGSWVVWDTYYQHKPNMKEWMPPFSSHAAIAGNQHYMTFDKQFYEYSGECSYVLAKDLIDGLFTVVVNYDTARHEKSLTVKVDGHTIEVAPGYKVNVNGHRSEMPVMVGETSVMRLGHLVRVHSPHGFTALCDLPHDRCSLNISGWYYAKTGGLFGTYDNEPFTDFRDSSGSPIDDAASLADAWTEGNRCRVTNNANTEHPDIDSDLHRMCSDLFDSDSSALRPCFMQVNHTEFMNMCLHDVASSESAEDASCDLASFYVDECSLAGVDIRMPRICVPCDHPAGGLFYEDEEVHIEGDDIPNSADVVLVVSQKACNTDIVPKLQDIVNRLDVSLAARGIESNLYGLVGYGGEGDYHYPHPHTMDGLLMGSKTKYTQASDTLPVFEGDHTEDPLAALEYAIHYPFRAGVAKVIMLIPCDTCYEYTTSYNDVADLLKDLNITLVTLLQNQFQVDKSNPSTSYIFGVDRHTVYTRKDFGDLDPVGDTSLRPQVAVPKDLCTALTDLSGGALYNSRHLMEARPQAMKKFMDVMGAVTALKGGEPTECQVCQCEPPTGAGVARTVCRPCEQPSLFFSIFPDLIDNFDNYAHDEPVEIAVAPQRRVNRRRQ